MSGPLTAAGEVVVSELAQRYRVSDGAVRVLLDAVVRGGGAMAQFSHPELGGNGQWMRGGMTMVGDMFNPGLQSTVSGICSELSSQLASGDPLVMPAARSTGAAGSLGGDWWPSDLGRPSASGGQNDAAYAYFPAPRRLAIRRGGTVNLYDTGDHAISGVQQQQGSRGSLEFSSQFGTFTVDTLPIVTGGGAEPRSPGNTPPAGPPAAESGPPAAEPGPPAAESGPPAAEPGPPAAAPPLVPPPAPPPTPAAPPPAPTRAGAASTAAEIGAAIETLGGLRDKGFLTEEEFTTKKAEILARL